MRIPERRLTEWEQAVVQQLSSLEVPGAARVRDSLPHLVVTGLCECGCASFDVRDSRYPSQPHGLDHFANGVSGGVGFALFLGEDGRPIAVDVDNEPGDLPDPNDIVVSAP